MVLVFPIGDEPNPRQRAFVNQVLIGINVAVFLFIGLQLMGEVPSHRNPLLLEYIRHIAAEIGSPADVLSRSTTKYDLVVYQFGFRPAEPSLVSLFTSMFLHANWGHLLSNIVILWIFGDNVEAKLGRVRYLLVYLLTGLAATLFFAAFQGHSHVPLVGASGAISGVLGCYFLWFPFNRVRLFIWFFFFVNVVPVSARVVLAFYLIFDNVLPFLRGDGGGVAHGAHIGGFLAGLLCVKVFDASRAPWRVASTGDPRRGVKGSETFDDAIRRKAWEVALSLFADMAPRARQDVEDHQLIVLADGLSEIERYEAALAVLQRFLATRPRSELLSVVHLRAGLIQYRGLRRLQAAYQHLLTVLDLSPPADVERAARQALEEIDSELGRP